MIVEWRNELEGPLPVSVTIAPEATDAGGVPVQCVAGLSGGTPDEHAVFQYPMDQRALLWYRDYVMGITKYGVYAGLAALWIVRDARELGCPKARPSKYRSRSKNRELRPRRVRTASRPPRAQDDTDVMGRLRAVRGRQWQGLAGARGASRRPSASA